jgi:hypothetical protein
VRTLVFLLSIVGGVIFAPSTFSAELPDWAQNQNHYARILNPIAAQVMAWIEQQQIDSKQAISLISADLLQIDNSHFRFELGTKHHSPKQQTTKTTRFNFIANETSSPQLETNQTSIVEQVNQSRASPFNNNGPLYYRARELAYWWLAHLDGVNNAHKQNALSPWINKASFKSERTQKHNAISTAMQPEISKSGGHLLRSIKIVPTAQTNQYELRLFVDWQGTLVNGKSGIANLEHIMFARLLDDGTFIVERIVEHVHLPSLEPWTKILC